MNVKYYLEPEYQRVMYKVNYDEDYQYEYISLDNQNHDVVDLMGTVSDEYRPMCDYMTEETMHHYGEDDPWFPFPIERFESFIEIPEDKYMAIRKMFTDAVEIVRKVLEEKRLDDSNASSNCKMSIYGRLWCKGESVYLDDTYWEYDSDDRCGIISGHLDYYLEPDCFEIVKAIIREAEEQIIKAYIETVYGIIAIQSL